MYSICKFFDALKVATGAGFSAMLQSQNVVPLLYLKNEKPRNLNTIKGLRFIPLGLKILIFLRSLALTCTKYVDCQLVNSLYLCIRK